MISINPEDWVRWATNVLDADNCEIVSGEFQFVSRNTDTLILVNESSIGKFLVLIEIQTYYKPEMPRRMRNYVALAEQRYDLPVFPVLINVLPYKGEIPNRYESSFLGITARQDYNVINLWELSAEDVLAQNFTALIPFIPTMRGGRDEKLLQRAQVKLRLDENLRESGNVDEFELILSVFTEAVLGKGKSNKIFRWKMLDIFVESPLYQEIVEQGLQQGLQQGRDSELKKVLLKQFTRRFGELGDDIKQKINNLTIEQAETLAEAIFDFNNVEELGVWLSNVK